MLALEGPVDYRLERLRDLPSTSPPLGAEADAWLERLFPTLSGGRRAGPRAGGRPRQLRVPRAAGGVALFDFADLCARRWGRRLSGADRALPTLILGRAAADARPAQRGAAVHDPGRRALRAADDAVPLRRGPARGALPAGDGAFEFQRTVSRLMEMQSSDYLAACRNRHPDQLPKTFTLFALTSDLI